MKTNNWCYGVDLNYDTEINIYDMMSFSSCWLEEDAEAPEPNPATWAIEPNSPAGTFNTINMMATQANDNWWPNEGDNIQYLYECQNYPSMSSSWLTEVNRFF